MDFFAVVFEKKRNPSDAQWSKTKALIKVAIMS